MLHKRSRGCVLKVLGYFLPLIARQMGLVSAALLLSLVTLAASVALLGLSGWFITASAVSTAGALFNIIGPSAAIRGLSLLRIAGRYGERYVGHSLTLGLLAKTRPWLFSRLFRQFPIASGLSRADIVSRLVSDLDAIDSLVLVALGPLSTAALAAITIGIGFALVLPIAALGFLLPFVAATVLVPMVMLHLSQQPGRAEITSMNGLRNHMLEGLDGHTDLAVFGQERAFAASAARQALVLGRHRIDLGDVSANASFAVTLLSAFALLVTLLLGLQALHAKLLDGPVLAAMLFATLASFEASHAVVRSVSRLARAIAAGERIKDLAERPQEPDAPTTAVSPLSFELSLKGVTFAYPGHEPILSDVSLHLPRGKHIAIVGESGSGKSTLAQLLVRLLHPQHGEYLLGGLDTGIMNSDLVRRIVTLMPQQAHIFTGSVRDNLLLARSMASDDDMWQVMTEVGLRADLESRAGLETEIGEAGAGISVGQARRVALARTLLMPASVIILDEPTAGLDRDAADAFLSSLSTVARNRSLIVITHLQSPVGFDEVLALRDGHLETLKTS